MISNVGIIVRGEKMKDELMGGKAKSVPLPVYIRFQELTAPAHGTCARTSYSIAHRPCTAIRRSNNKPPHCGCLKRHQIIVILIRQDYTGGKGAFTQQAHGEFIVSSETKCPPNCERSDSGELRIGFGVYRSREFSRV